MADHQATARSLREPAPESTPESAAVAWLSRHEMAGAGLLFFLGHRPLAFLTGQLFHVAAPAAALLGIDQCAAWAALLSDPDRLDQLERALDHAAQPHA